MRSRRPAWTCGEAASLFFQASAVLTQGSERAGSTPSPRPGPLLGIDSCGMETSLVLGEMHAGGITVFRKHTLAPRTAGTEITGALRDVLGEVMPAGLRAIVVVRGPGSFTGMRIGLSAAKALSEAAGVPMVGVSRLAVLAEKSGSRQVALDAGRGSVFLRSALREAGLEGASEREPAATRGEWGEELLEVGLLREMLTGRAGVEGSTLAAGLAGLAVCEDRVLAMFPEAQRVDPPDAADALASAHARILQGDWDDTETLDALYLWRAEQMLRSPKAQL